MATATLSPNQQSRKLRLLCTAGLFAALIYVLTAYLHVPTTKGYIHLGDGLIYLCASFLPAPYAIAASAIGGAMSDALSGYWIWVPATLVIKGLTAACFSHKSEKIISVRNIIALVPALALCVLGYGFYSGLVIYGSIPLGFADALANTFQVAGSTVLYVVAGIAFDKAGIKKKYFSIAAQEV